jgi:hypothetical protein
MRIGYYSDFIGLNRTTNIVDAPQVTFQKLDNLIPNRVKGALVPRPGSTVWATTGTVYGIGSFSKESASYLVPNVEHVIRHRRNGGTSTIERLDWGTSSWTAITLGAQTSFGITGIATFAQIDTVQCICGGRPAYLTDPTSGSINRLGGPAPATAPTWGTSAGSLTGQAYGCYTFYDSTTGWESSPSPLTSLTTLTADQIDWSGLETTCAKEGVDKKRLYRTQSASEGEGLMYRVGEVNLAVTTFTDDVADAAMTSASPDIGDHDAPPTSAYLCIAYANRFWIATGNELWYSLPYDGSVSSLQYFSEDRVFRFSARITGLAFTPDFGRLLVFLPVGKGIHYVSGRSEETFEQDIFKATEGTNFPSSISSHEEMVSYWGANGPTIITPGGVVTDFAEDLKEMFRDLATKEYNSDVFIWSAWHPVLESFIWGFAASDTATSQWADAVTDSEALWRDAVDLVDVEWQ